MKALFIEVKNWALGERAGIDNSDIEDGNLVCLAGTQHQSLDSMPKGNYEVRVVKDDRDLSQYKGEIILADGSTVSDPANLTKKDDIVDVNGVVMLDGKDQINKVIKQAIPPKYQAAGDFDAEKAQDFLKAEDHTPVPGPVPEKSYDVLKRAHEKGHTKVSKLNPPTV